MYFKTKKPFKFEDKDGNVKIFTISFVFSRLTINVTEYNEYSHQGENALGEFEYEIVLFQKDRNEMTGAKLFNFRKCEIDAILKTMRKWALNLVKKAFDENNYSSHEMDDFFGIAENLQNLTWKKPAWVEEDKEQSMIIIILISVSIGYFLGRFFALHPIPSLLYKLESKGLLCGVVINFGGHDLDSFVHKYKYFLSVRGAEKYALKTFTNYKKQMLHRDILDVSIHTRCKYLATYTANL